MIFVTVGHQLPFDRLVRLVDAWAGARGRSDVFAQVGHTSYRPKNFAAVETLSPTEFRERLKSASAIVAHAGIGTIFSALELSKPLLVLPRLVRHEEVRSDHQIPTAKYFDERKLLLAAYTDEELTEKLDQLESYRAGAELPKTASEALITRLKSFIANA